MLTSAAARDSAYGGISPIAVPIPQSKDAGYTFDVVEHRENEQRRGVRDQIEPRQTEQVFFAHVLFHRYKLRATLRMWHGGDKANTR